VDPFLVEPDSARRRLHLPRNVRLLGRGERSWLAVRWREETNERLRLAKEAGGLEREHRQIR
jgi:hypothetical protein